MNTNVLNVRKRLVLLQIFSVLLVLSRAPRSVLALEDDRHYREDEDRDINDEGADTEFSCNVLDGKFRDTSGPNAVLTYAYEMEYMKEKSPIHLASKVTNYISKGLITSMFEGCTSDDRRRIEETLASSPLSDDTGRSLAAGGNDLIVGFETTPEVKPARGRECDTQPHSREHACMVFSGGITIYFPDNKRKRERRRRLQGEMDFGGRFSDEDHAIQEINHLIKNSIEFGNIPQKVFGIQKLTYRILPVTEEPSDQPSSVPSDTPSALPTAEETSRNEVNNVLEEPPPTNNGGSAGGSALAIAMVGVAMVVCSIVGAIYIKKRREVKESRREQAEGEMEAKDVLLDTYVPTGEMIRPLATEQGVVEVIWDEEERS